MFLKITLCFKPNEESEMELEHKPKKQKLMNEFMVNEKDR